MKHPSAPSAVALVALVFVALVLAACGSAPTGPSAPPPTVATAPDDVPTPEPSAIPSIPPTPASVASLEERLVAEIEVANPDELAYLGGFVWVKTDDGHVVQVDPATNRVLADVVVDTTSSPYHYCQGLGSDGTNLWVCSAAGDDAHQTIDVVRLDPDRRSVVATVAVGKVFDQFGMPTLLGHLWVLADGGTRLVGIDLATHQPGPSVDLGARCFQVAAASRSLLVTCKLDDLVLRVDPWDMAITQRRSLASPRDILARDDGVWVSLDSGLVRLDPASLEPVVTFTGLPGDKALMATADAIWVRLDQGFLFRIDPLRNQLVEQISPGERRFSMGSVLVTPEGIWTTASNERLLLRLSLE